MYGVDDLMAHRARQHHGVDLTGVLPARLTGGAFAVWLQMPEASRDSADAVRDALGASMRPDDGFGETPTATLLDVRIVVNSKDRRVTLEVLVVPDRPLGVDIMLGMSGITALGGISMQTPTDVRFCAAAAVTQRGLEVDAVDFTWTDGTGPECLRNLVAEYPVSVDARQAYDAEIDAWINKGWLMPYDKQVDGPPHGLVPLMAVRQANQDKVRPLLDYRELNSFVMAHTAGADVCADQLRKWRRHGTRVAVVDLRKAHLQLRLERRLRPYQTVMDIVSADRVVRHFARFGLTCKAPEREADGARLLGLRVQLVDGKLHWSRDNGVAAPPEQTADIPRTNDPARGSWRLTGEKVIVWTDASAIAAGVVIESPDDGVVQDACWLRPETATSTHINMAVCGINQAIAWGMEIVDLRTGSATVHRWIDDVLSGRARLRTKAHGEMLIRRRIDVIRQLVDELSLTLTVALVRTDENLADTLTLVPKEWLRGTQVDDGVPARILARTGGAGAVGCDESMRIGSRAAAAAVHDGADAAKGSNSMDIEARIIAAHESAGHPGIRRTLYFT
ncbi:uncharacterized protein LOC119103095 [Pollicipes pollicipes]|uniref:uncharacterized protein LOC119103095 n=1 Tax=Pollicipes pollicipes TaxID=41117 RepID=UPI001885200D|nr:uncharacterized protein LOC119103095 [Pollicipes pollicipes]